MPGVKLLWGCRGVSELSESVMTARPGEQQNGTSAATRTGIFLVSNTLEVGGSERQFVALVEALDRGLFDVQPACLRRIGPLVARVPGIAEFPVGGSLFRLQSMRARRAMARRMREAGISIAHAFDFYSNMMLIPAARWAGVPVVVGSHRQIGDLMTRAQFAAQRFVFRFCDRVVCNSKAAAESLQKAGLPTRKVEIIPNGLAEQVFATASPAMPKKPGVVRIGMIARMNDPVKNHPAFLQAAAQLTRKFPNLEFLLVGDGPLRSSLEKMSAELGLGDHVIFAGERHDIPAMLASMDVSVLISGSESLSNVILESMAAGVPVVATNVGGNPELITHGKTGFLVPPGNEAAFVEAVAPLIASPDLRKRFSHAAQDFARANFHMETVWRRYERLYLGILAEKSGKLSQTKYQA